MTMTPISYSVSPLDPLLLPLSLCLCHLVANYYDLLDVVAFYRLLWDMDVPVGNL